MSKATAPERAELARLCRARDWSKAIRVLDSLLSRSCCIQDICNRAFCYSQLELHKHVVKDCDRALQMDSGLLQAYILKGKALSALGRIEDALLVWEKGHEIAVRESTDLKQLLDLEDLLIEAKETQSVVCAEHEADMSLCDTKNVISEQPVISCTEATSIPDTKIILCETNFGNSHSGVSSSSCNETDYSKEVLGRSDDSTASSDSEELGLLDQLFVARMPKSKSISLDLRLSRGIAQVNEGNYDEAIAIFNQILRETPNYPEALIGRGTAYAFQRELNSAIADFSKAIQSNPAAGEAWKRRGQARAALGEFTEAIKDLSTAMEFEPSSSDILHERGIVNFKFKDYNSAVSDLSTCLKRDKKNSSAHTYYGLALAAVGEYKQAEDEHLLAIKFDRNFLDSWAHLAQLYLDLANPGKALSCIKEVLSIDSRFTRAYHLRALVYHGMGQHRLAIKELSVALSIESSNIECLYLRASCNHAIGEYKAAVKDYDGVLDLELDSMDKFVLQCLAFYQKEIALYTASKVNFEFFQFNIDDDIDPIFKVYWCKRLHPKDVAEKVYRQPPLKISLKSGRLNKQEYKFTRHQLALLQAADAFGMKIQYNSPGFLPNKRQYRMAGLAVIEIAQKVSKAWRVLRHPKNIGKLVRRREKINSHNRGGSCSTSSLSKSSAVLNTNEDRLISGLSLLWQDVYNIAVKWRQISEPCDPVVWVNKLSEEFKSGFGSHTPMLLGQARVVRYYPYYQRVLDNAKTIILNTKYVNNALDQAIPITKFEQLEKIKIATSCVDLYTIVGENFWLATKCDSVAFEGKRLEGTRITVQKMEKVGFDFAIRTPCTPSRWEDYDHEMTLAWEALCELYCCDTAAVQDVSMLDGVKDAILQLTYYWYNFMPLSRGSAVVGYIVMLGLLLAANMEVTADIPAGVQVDWEAIISPSPGTFSAIIKPWLYPSIKMSKSWRDCVDVSSAFGTTGSVVAALTSVDT